jgi:hypothetical protein
MPAVRRGSAKAPAGGRGGEGEGVGETDGEAEPDAVDDGDWRAAPTRGRYVMLTPRVTACGGEMKDTLKRETGKAHVDHVA